MDHWRYLFLFQEFGDVNTNNLGHTVTMTVHPLTKRKVKAVFMPKKPEGVWSGEIVESSMVQAETLIDDDVSALRKNQLCLDWIELNRPDRCDIDCQCQSQMLCCVFCLWVIASATAAATEGKQVWSRTVSSSHLQSFRQSVTVNIQSQSYSLQRNSRLHGIAVDSRQ